MGRASHWVRHRYAVGSLLHSLFFSCFSGWVNSLRPHSGVMGLLIACMSRDVAVDGHSNPLLVRIHLRKSKADQLGRRVNIYLGRTDEDLCPVAALLAYLAVCGREPGPLFELSNGHFLTKQTFSARVRSALSVLDYACSSYAGHSFRIGAATTAAEWH